MDCNGCFLCLPDSLVCLEQLFSQYIIYLFLLPPPPLISAFVLNPTPPYTVKSSSTAGLMDRDFYYVAHVNVSCILQDMCLKEEDFSLKCNQALDKNGFFLHPQACSLFLIYPAIKSFHSCLLIISSLSFSAAVSRDTSCSQLVTAILQHYQHLDGGF